MRIDNRSVKTSNIDIYDPKGPWDLLHEGRRWGPARGRLASRVDGCPAVPLGRHGRGLWPWPSAVPRVRMACHRAGSRVRIAVLPLKIIKLRSGKPYFQQLVSELLVILASF